MKKIILFLLIFVIGCSAVSTAKSPVEKYLNSYNDLEYEVMLDLEEVVNSESNLADNQRDLYRDILKKQYLDLKYEIISENYDNDNATVLVEITVYDYQKSASESANYLKTNPDQFYNEEGMYDSHLYMDYKLNNLKEVTDKIKYEIEFNVIKENDIWILNTVSEEDLQKIHGIYNEQ